MFVLTKNSSRKTLSSIFLQGSHAKTLSLLFAKLYQLLTTMLCYLSSLLNLNRETLIAFRLFPTSLIYPPLLYALFADALLIHANLAALQTRLSATHCFQSFAKFNPIARAPSLIKLQTLLLSTGMLPLLLWGAIILFASHPFASIIYATLTDILPHFTPSTCLQKHIALSVDISHAINPAVLIPKRQPL